jgi:hypothetical protein
MKKLTIIPQLIFISVITGCATAYQMDGFSGGFEETQLSSNAWKINFAGNGYTSQSRSEGFTLLRSADITMQNGFNYFIIVGSNSDMSTTSSWTSPSTSTTNFNGRTASTTNYGGNTFYITKPSSTNIILMFKEKPEVNGIVYDAQFLCKSLGAKYDIQCGKLK